MDNIFGEDLKNSSTIFKSYLKSMKIKTNTNKYFYVIRHNIFGNILFVTNPGNIIMTKCDNLSDKYFNKIYSTDVVYDKTVGFETDIGILENFDSITRYNAVTSFNKSISTLEELSSYIRSCADIDYISGLNNDERFYNDVLLRKTADGASRYILKNKVIYLTPSMLPGTKKTDLDARIYNLNNNYNFIVEFISHKDNLDIQTFMNFLDL